MLQSDLYLHSYLLPDILFSSKVDGTRHSEYKYQFHVIDNQFNYCDYFFDSFDLTEIILIYIINHHHCLPLFDPSGK